mmetsp:Transcript_51995/g.123151  ORF Transcript_51995/g.123151 Transcript_51995/m.123151 type:complete len:202 (-) Transcript_51995:271-876(-)
MSECSNECSPSPPSPPPSTVATCCAPTRLSTPIAFRIASRSAAENAGPGGPWMPCDPSPPRGPAAPVSPCGPGGPWGPGRFLDACSWRTWRSISRDLSCSVFTDARLMSMYFLSRAMSLKVTAFVPDVCSAICALSPSTTWRMYPMFSFTDSIATFCADTWSCTRRSASADPGFGITLNTGRIVCCGTPGGVYVTCVLGIP